MEWEESWNTMEPFSVTVVPTDSDLFQDMQPVLTKTRKVYVGGEVADEKRPDKRKFAVEAEFIGQETSELGEWADEEVVEGGGWEGEAGREEVTSLQVMAQQRREEREKRKKLQEALRFSQRRQQHQPSLGVRLSDSS
ncbi:hypothetical protein GBAR_LOCUS13988 [Geodia barretti]|uniref:Uncharacterized protein n=1 Tax=Geodia barretti TaxID=519541 RepID=A0AA35S7M0_GEOBA|nr:hypothetical protein GBAR_LOCUS13988 [Geodia barretti]